MTQEEFNAINWHRGNTVKLINGKEYLVKGVKGRGRYLLLHSEEYNSCFIADHQIVDSRISDYEEPKEVYLEYRRKRLEAILAREEEERQERLRIKAERKRRNLEEQERIHQEALARKAARIAKANSARKKAKPAKPKAQPEPVAEKPVTVEKPSPEVAKPAEAPKAETADEQPKPKRKRTRIRIPKNTEL